MKKLIILLVVVVTVCCVDKNDLRSSSTKIINVIGEIFPYSAEDGKDFKLCGAQDRIVQYYAFHNKTYKGEKMAIIQHFQKGFKPIPNSRESGLIRIRFIVNCKGEAGRFRMLSADSEYQPKAFSDKVMAQLLALIKDLKGWKAMQVGNQFRDYYQYLIFRIEEGELIEIMP